MKRFACHADKKSAKGFKQEPNRLMIRFHKDDSVGRAEDGLQRPKPKARREVHQLSKFRKENKV